MKVEAERVSHPPTRVRRLSMRKLIVGLTLAFAFAMYATGQTEKILFKFTGGRDGGNPEGGLIFRGGNLYGTASTGGSYLSGCGGAGCGTVFELKTHGFRLGPDCSL
jgi:hypothetical protein